MENSQAPEPFELMLEAANEFGIFRYHGYQFRVLITKFSIDHERNEFRFVLMPTDEAKKVFTEREMRDQICGLDI